MVIMDSAESVGSLEEQALKRKERLKNLKRKRTNSDNTSHNTTNETMTLPKPKFRSYKPQDGALQESKLSDAEPTVIEEEVKDLLEAGKEKVVLQDLDITSLAPRKPDWDLKRDVAKKLEKLERKTQRAIAELIWDRLKHGNEDNLSAMITMTANRPTITDDD
ncbi:coiled-coil domain containing 12-like protein [Bombyx mori]|uniref:coiled-coil domain containing 12-like protein n=1 Tax=Bombyx mori TaxID=7091 RepID=UPI002ED3F524